MNELVALVAFPGLLFMLVLTVVLNALVEGVPRLGDLRLPRFGFESAAGLASLLLAVLGSALLPWPLNPAQSIGPLAGPLAAFATIEGAFLIALLPGLLAPNALVNRAVIRETQIGVAGRAVVWIALGTLLWQTGAWTVTSAPGRLLLSAAGLLALPAAIGVGPFAADGNLTLSGAEHGLDSGTSGFIRFVRRVRGTVLFSAVLLALLPLNQIRPTLALVLSAAVALVVVLMLRRLNGRMPRVTVPTALRWCWWRALPLAAVGLVYLAFVR